MILYHAHYEGMDTTEGYIGVTINLEVRISQHKYESQAEHRAKYNYPLYKAMREGTVYFTVLARGSEEEMYALESNLRPSPYMGWNNAAGGFQGGNTLEGVKRPEHSEWCKKNGFQSGNTVGDKTVMAGGFLFRNKQVAGKVLGIDPKTIYNRAMRGYEGYIIFRDESNELI